MDFISHSPSLADIISFVDHKDMLSSQLVNQALYQCTKRNSRKMPRRRIDLTIFHYKRIIRGCRYFVVRCDLMPNEMVYIMDKSITFKSQSSAFSEYHNKNVTQQLVFPGSEEEKTIKDVIGTHVNEQRMHYVSYRNNGLEVGLRTVLSHVFRQYFFKTLLLNCTSTPLLKIIIEEFRQNQSNCVTLNTEQILSFDLVQMLAGTELRELVHVLGCKTIITCVQKAEGKMNTIRGVVRWNQSITLNLKTRLLAHYYIILQNWASGLLSLNEVELRSEARQDQRTWYHAELDPVLGSLVDVKSVNEENVPDDNLKRRFRIARRNDAKTLLLTSYYEKVFPYSRHIFIREE